MQQITFSYNWNNKLNCNAFTTLRPFNPNKYKLGEQYELLLKNAPIGVYRIAALHTLDINQINTTIALIDTGYLPEQCKEVIRKMYKLQPNQAFKLNLITLVKIS